MLLTVALFFTLGTDFFPTADVGIIKLHYRGPSGLRIEETEKSVLAVEGKIRQIIPAGELRTINDMIGVPLFYNLAFAPTDNVAGNDAEILIQLNEGHRPSVDYIRKMRAELPGAFPDSNFYFQTADIVSQVLNFGLSAPIDIQIQGTDIQKSFELGQQILAGIGKTSRRRRSPHPAGDVLSGPDGGCGSPARRRSGRQPEPGRRTIFSPHCPPAWASRPISWSIRN